MADMPFPYIQSKKNEVSLPFAMHHDIQSGGSQTKVRGGSVLRTVGSIRRADGAYSQ